MSWAKAGNAAQLAIFARRGDHRHLPRRLRLLRRGHGPHRALGAAGRLGAVRHGRRSPRSTSSSSAARRRPARCAGDRIPPVSQYVLIFIAVTFTWLMGLMGYVRSGLRQHWHVYGVMRDTLARRVHADARLRDEGRLGDRAHVLPADRLRVLAREPARQARLRGRTAAASGSGTRRVMKVPLIVRIGALVVATTGVLHLRRPDGAAEGSPAAAGDRAQKRPDHRRDGQGRPRDHGGQGTLLHLPHDRQDRARSASPTSTGVGARAKTPRARAERRRVLRRSRCTSPNAFIVPGFNPGMPTINKPPIGLTDQEILCVIAYLQTLGGTPTVTLQTKLTTTTAARPRRRQRRAPAAAAAPAPAPGAAPAARRSGEGSEAR